MSIQKAISKLSTSSQGIFSLAWIVYVVGFVVLLGHFHRYGIATTSLFNIDYLKAGLCSVMLMSPVLGAVIARRKANQEDFDSQGRALVAFWFWMIYMVTHLLFFRLDYEYIYLYISVYAVLAFVGGFMFLAMRTHVPIWWERIMYFQIIIYGTVLLILGFVSLAMYTYLLMLSIIIVSTYITELVTDVKGWIFRALVVVAISSMFGQFVYYGVDYKLGGGSPVLKSIVLSDNNDVTLAPQLQKYVAFDTLLPVTVLYEDQQYIYLLEGDSLVLRLDQILVTTTISKLR